MHQLNVIKMEGTGETHYISFLGGDGGGMGNRRPTSASSSSTPRGGNRRFGSQPLSLRQYLLRKRFGGMQAKAQLLLVAACVCLLCFAGFFLMVPKDSGSVDSDIIPFPPSKPVVDVDTEGYPPKIYDWEEYHFAHAFNAFMSEHGKKYSNTVERERRYKIFKSNLTHIYLHNEQGKRVEKSAAAAAVVDAFAVDSSVCWYNQCVYVLLILPTFLYGCFCCFGGLEY